MADENKTPDKGNGNETPPAGITPDEVGKMVHGALADFAARKLPGMISESISGIGLEDKIAEAIAKATPKPPEGGDKKKGDGKPDLPPEVQAQLQKLASDLENEKAARTAAEKQRIEIEQARRFDAGLSDFRSAVSQKVRPELLDVFVRDVASGQRRLSVSEDGEARLRVRKAPYKGAPEEEVDLPLGEAVPILLASKDAAPFLPAPGGGSSSSHGTNLPTFTLPSSGGDNNARSEHDKAQAVVKKLQDMGLDPTL